MLHTRPLNPLKYGHGGGYKTDDKGDGPEDKLYVKMLDFLSHSCTPKGESSFSQNDSLGNARAFRPFSALPGVLHRFSTSLLLGRA